MRRSGTSRGCGRDVHRIKAPICKGPQTSRLRMPRTVHAQGDFTIKGSAVQLHPVSTFGVTRRFPHHRIIQEHRNPLPGSNPVFFRPALQFQFAIQTLAFPPSGFSLFLAFRTCREPRHAVDTRVLLKSEMATFMLPRGCGKYGRESNCRETAAAC